MASIQPRLQAKPPYSIEVPGQTPQKGETTIRRIPAAVPDLVAKPDPNISTLYELVRVSVEKYGYVYHNKTILSLELSRERGISCAIAICSGSRPRSVVLC